ncbi:sp110 nuclear body protein isoform X2 [Arvicanthis niloticus]|uniref:sp110 nuclear body protein isoform X2 n=1 Tax=Arvicanthis niloticus TaxID=61156 RepID=UPI0014866FA1|nr:sp110 nuclear body protein isoform X2 [Arvicanthis niloticus]
MFTLTKALEKALLQHFIYTKLDIAYAINKPFPFFEALRDNSFITERMYKESLEACKNLVPLSRVVHNVLTSLEQTFHPSMLLTLFSQVNLREYPSLVAIFRSFRNVGYAYEGRNRPTPTLLEAPANPAEGCSLHTLLPPPPPQPSPSLLSSARRVCNPGATSQPITEILDEQPSPSPQATPLPGCIQEGTTTSVSSRDHQRENKEDSREMPHSSSGPESVVQDDSPAPNNLEMPQEAPPCTPANKKARKRKSCIWSNSKRRRREKKPPQDEMMGTASPGHGVQEKRKVVAQRTLRKGDSTRNVKEVTRTLRARRSCAQTSGLQEISKETSKRSRRKRPGKRPRTARKTTHVPEKSKDDDTVDFLSPTLSVTCGKAKGTLFLEKLNQGSSKKCIQNEAGAWFTVKEFLKEGGRARSKDWKRAICCAGKTLRFLEQKGLWFYTSKSKPHKKGA